METKKRIITGTVVSDAMDKTIVVKVERVFRHPRFEKVMRTFKKYKVHDENGIAKVGDKVEISQVRPISKTKYMTLNCVV